MFQRILLPIDGSELSESAASHATELARQFDATVVVLQVIDSEVQIITHMASPVIEPIASGQITVDVARQAVAGQRERAQENVERVAAYLRDAGLGEVETTVVEGVPGPAVAAAATALGCDTVVMATHGRSGFKRTLLGSVADYVARNTPTAAVLLIRPPDRSCAPDVS
jgi:nucleotide-binding universal stress UspA family protein